MIQAYEEGKDLYAVIAQSAFDNNYEDNLEFYPPGTELELDGKKVICGKKTHLNKAGKERRAFGKVLLLAANYGMSGKTAGERMGKSKEEGEKLLSSFFGRFSGVKKAIDGSKEFLKKNGYVEDWAGRRRRLPEINLPSYEVRLKDEGELANFNPFIMCANRDSSNDPKIAKWRTAVSDAISRSNQWQRKNNPNFTGNDEMSNTSFEKLAKEALADGVIISSNTGRRAQAERQCFNARIQGGAASLTKLAMINIDRDPVLNELDAHLVITVHDEVLVECPALYAEQVKKRLPQVMVDTAKPYINVPMQCDPYNVSHWYEDEAAVAIREEFKKLEAGNPDKGVAPLPREEALKAVYRAHPEHDEAVLYNVIANEADLAF